MESAEKKKGYIAAIVYSCIIGFSFLAVKTSLVDAGTPILLAHRFTVAFAGVLVAEGALRIPIRIKVREYLRILPLTVFYPVLYFWLQSAGLESTPSSIAGILQSTAPVFSAILAAAILKEKTVGLQLVGIVFTVAGVALLSLGKGGPGMGAQGPAGPVLLVLSALAMGCYSVLSRKLSRQYPVFTLTFWMLLTGFVVFNVYAAVYFIGSGGPALYLAPLHRPGYLIAILYLGILSSLVTAYLSNYALARMEAAKMSVFGSLATVISVVVGVVFLHEPFHMALLVGMCVIIAGVLLVNSSRGKRSR